MNSPMNTSDPEKKSEFASNLDIFRQIDFFCAIPVEVIKLFAFLCQRKFYKQGDYIFFQDDDDKCSYFILSGKANLVFSKNGKEYFIREYGPESYFGVLSLLTPMIKQFSLIASEDTICIVMTRQAFTKVTDQFPDTAFKIARTIGQRIMKTERRCLQEFEASQTKDLKSFLGISLI